MLKNKYVLFAHIVIVLTGCMAAASAWAIVREPPNLLALPWLQIAGAGLIALWGGVVRTSIKAVDDARRRIDKPNEPTGFSLKNELVKDFFLSSGLGFAIFLFGYRSDWDDELLAAALFIGGYLGTQLIVAAGDLVLGQIANMTKKDKP